MERSTRRGAAAGSIAVSMPLAVVSTAPGVTWGLGCLLAVALFVAGVSAWTKPEPARIYDHATDGV